MPAMASRLPLLNTIASPDQLREPPSGADGVPARLEFDMRDIGCELIQTAGILLKLPQVTMATAQVLFQKFFYVASARKFAVRVCTPPAPRPPFAVRGTFYPLTAARPFQDIAMGALFLASKLQESPRKVRDIVNTFDQAVKIARKQPTDPLQLFGTVGSERQFDTALRRCEILSWTVDFCAGPTFPAIPTF
ncbi:MAG: cyclin-like protein [Olpidium bornovanus]|uniref:Cyclin-like protein n=1 Tax=Olpidium bornovanus TaxID=278681 RepID=A0A8H8DM89_9FUNG|nr:MAG: cyclin-like protein [Olpidium bornovanus]